MTLSSEAPRADWINVDPMARWLVPEWFAKSRNVFPLRFDDQVLVVATSDPSDLQLERELEFASGRRVRFALADAADLEAAWATGYAPEPVTEGAVGAPEIEDDAQAVETSTVGDDSPIAKLAYRLLDDALEQGASDLHVEPTQAGGVVRARIDGVLEQLAEIPPELYRRLVSRLKVKGDLDIADRMRPQDGRATHHARDSRVVELRISAIPTRDGEKLVIRFLDPGNVRTLEELGLLPPEAEALARLLDQRDGIVALTGPTGAGKTSTLYAALARLDTEHTNVCTVEDPIEYRLPGANQVQVNVTRGVTFASALRAFLRQDPDVILLGEIRDEETASVAVQAALTGHLVLTTLHTNDAVSALARLDDLGVDQAAVADSLRGVVAQRLVRKLCDHCAVAVDSSNELDDAEALLRRRYGVTPARRPVGCSHCRNTGYRGRLAVAEVLPIAGAVDEAVREGRPAAVVRASARAAGVRSMREVAGELVRLGRTTLSEVHRVLGESGAAPIEPVPAAVQAASVNLDDLMLGTFVELRNASTPPSPALSATHGQSRGADAGKQPAAPGASSVEHSTARQPERRAGVHAALGLTGRWDGPTGQWLFQRKQGPAVLLADQDEADLLAWERHLTAKGWRITTAVDGEEARRYLKAQDFDLAILRLRLPTLSGREILARLSRSGRAVLPVLIITNLQSDELEAEVIAEGAEDYIRKPVSPGEMERRALAVLRRRYPEKVNW